MNSIRHHLQELLDAGERTDPPVFSGREEEIDRIVRATGRLPPDGPKGRTILIQGAPGSGKTALIAEVCARLGGLRDTGIVSLASVPANSTAERVYARLAALLVGAAPAAQNRGETRTQSGEVNIGVARVGVRTSRTTTPAHLSAEDIADSRGGGWRPKRRAVVFVDEVQMLKPGSRAAELLFDLHTQAKIPVLLVCAGLGNSRLALSNAGFSRIEAPLALGRLAETETLDCARRTLRKVVGRGVPATDVAVERWAAALAKAADDWPRHLQVYFQATWRILLRQEDADLDKAPLDAAIAIGDRRRAEYYEDRLAASRTPIEIIASLHRRLAVGSGIRESDAHRVIGAAAQRLDTVTREEWDAQFNARPKKCFESLLRSGIVSLDSMYRCTSPVPSFSRYILGRVRDARR